MPKHSNNNDNAAFQSLESLEHLRVFEDATCAQRTCIWECGCVLCIKQFCKSPQEHVMVSQHRSAS